ncbi:MAG: PDZ domain-containing protein [Microthrixaceae bacterium]
MTDSSLPTPGAPADPGDAPPSAAAPGTPGGDDLVDAGVADATGPHRRRSRRRLVWLGAILAGLALLAGLLFVPTPYYLLEPGSVRASEPLVSVEGAPTYRTKGAVMFTTVYIDQATVATLLRGAVDDAIEVKSEDEIYGKEGRGKSQQVNQQRMDLSKLVATKVALNRLGYPAEFTANGARVLGLSDDSPSKDLLRPGDVITAVDGRPVALPSDIGRALDGSAPGDQVTVQVRRGDATETVTVTLGAAPDDAARPVLGVSVDPDDPRLDSPVQVNIDSGDVTGPSAGLAWALAVIDRLTPGSLTDGRRVAVTGEILPDGTVGAIGGIEQKVAAVKRNGVKLFLYPESTPAAERRAIERVAGDDLELRPVATLDDAIRILDPDGNVDAEARKVAASQAAAAPATPSGVPG